MEYTLENNVCTIQLQGRIDSANAPAAENEILQIRAKAPQADTVLDCEKLEYISSAGLRVILRLKKAVPGSMRRVRW